MQELGRPGHGMAGESARQEYERRRRRDAERRRRALPWYVGLVLGAGATGLVMAEQVWPGRGGLVGIVTAALAALVLGVELAPKYSTTAFAKGAAGELAVAEVLDGLGSDWYAFHDRRLPRGPQLDHLVVGTGGIFTVDAKRYRGRLERRGGSIRIAGRDKTSLLRQAEKQAATIATLLDEMPGFAMPVAPILCFVGTELPKHHLVVEGVHVVTRRGLKKMLGKAAGPHGQDLVTQTAAFLDDRLKLAGKSSFTATAEARTAG